MYRDLSTVITSISWDIYSLYVCVYIYILVFFLISNNQNPGL